MTTPGVRRPRYDGFADWYEAFNVPYAAANGPELEHTLGTGEGVCLDLGCGTGLYFDAIRATGRIPIGLDRSADQLRYARPRGLCVQADAAALPFPDCVFPTVVMVWLSTDVDDFAVVVAEATRVLRPGGPSATACATGSACAMFRWPSSCTPSSTPACASIRSPSLSWSIRCRSSSSCA